MEDNTIVASRILLKEFIHNIININESLDMENIINLLVTIQKNIINTPDAIVTTHVLSYIEQGFDTDINTVLSRVSDIYKAINAKNFPNKDVENYARKVFNVMLPTLATMHVALKNANKELDNTKTEIINVIQQELDKKIKSTEKNYIAILGIFASIVVTLAGGFSFSSSVLENIHQSSFERVAFSVVLIALFTSNILYALFSFLSMLVYERNIIKSCVLIVTNIILGIFLAVFTCVELNKEEDIEITSAPTIYLLPEGKK